MTGTSPDRGGSGALSALRLRPLLLAVLFMAMMPVGIAVIWQAHALLREQEEKSASALMFIARARAGDEQTRLRTVFGAIDALSASDTLPGPECARVAERLVERIDGTVFAGFASAEGRLDCRSDGAEPEDISGREDFTRILATPRTTVSVSPQWFGGESPVAVTMAPLERDGALLGFVSVSISVEAYDEPIRDDRSARFYHAAWLGPQGTGLLGPRERPWLPGDLAARLDSLGEETALFRAEDSNGRTRVYTLTRLFEGDLYEVTAWAGPPDRSVLLPLALLVALPALLALAGLGAAYVAFTRTIVRPLRALQDQARRIAGVQQTTGRTGALRSSGTREIAEIGRAFDELAGRLGAEDTAAEVLRAANVVLQNEVHHRVRNNLQIITSLIRMKRRETKDGPAADILARMEKRVLTLAAVHGWMDQSDDPAVVEAGPLIERVLDTVVDSDWRDQARLETGAVRLEPSAALCFGLIVNEVLGLLPGTAEDPWPPVVFSLLPESAEMAVFSFTFPCVGGHADMRGFSATLIESLTMQLEGSHSDVCEDGQHRFTLRLPQMTEAPQPPVGP